MYFSLMFFFFSEILFLFYFILMMYFFRKYLFLFYLAWFKLSFLPIVIKRGILKNPYHTIISALASNNARDFLINDQIDGNSAQQL